MTDKERQILRKDRIGNWLRAKRVAARLTQWDVARAMQYTTAQYISNFERGLGLPPSARLGELAKLLGVPAKELVEVVYGCLEAELAEERRQALQMARRSA